MDELLVTWLGSGNVYENVLNLIESYRQEETNGNTTDGNDGTAANINNGNSNNSTSDHASPPSSPRRKSKGSRFDDDNILDEANSNNDNGDNKKVSIPPFYRPPGTYQNGSKLKSIRRNRSDSFDSDQSWDGVYSVDSTGGTESSKENNDTTNDNPAGGDKDSAAKSNVPIKEQVRNIFAENGKLPSSSPSPLSTLQTDNESSKYLTIDNFVKITKDICNFPTFFNKPLYKRIMYLWNTQDIKSSRGKLIIWNEYYENAEDLDIGVDGDGDGDGDVKEDGDNGKDDADGENKEKKRNKKKSNELMDQLDKFITLDIFKWYWTQEMEDYDLSERFFRLMKKPHQDYLAKDDFAPFIQELLNDHPVSVCCVHAANGFISA